MIIAPEDWPGKKYRDRYCYEHQYVFWKETGQIPKKGQCIHHKNGEKRDNRIENLELVEVKKHKSHHGREKGRLTAELKCPNCDKIFEKEQNKTHLVRGRSRGTFCSAQCSGSFSKYFVGNRMTADAQRRLDENVIRVYKKIPG